MPNLRHRINSLALMSLQVPGFICIATSIGWARERSTVIHILSSTFKQKTNRISLKCLQTGRHDLRIVVHRLRLRVCEWGPKNYAYTVIDTVTGRAATVCKVWGITLNYNAKQLVNFDVIKAMILGTGEHAVTLHTVKKI